MPGRNYLLDVLGERGLLIQLTKAVVERVPYAEMTSHLCYEERARRSPIN